ncbi:MAG: hypothetical protein QM710_13855 [Flavobacterium sp.]
MSFDFSVSAIERFNDMEKYKQKVSELRGFENGTLGKQIADCLDNHKLTLVPGYESHDLKHVLLDYKMTAEDEIRMQAFMLGNGNHTIPCFAILGFGAMLLPDLWPIFYQDYKKGRDSIPISNWTIDNYAKSNIDELRLKLKKPETQKQPAMNLKTITKFGAFASLFAGISGMLFCLPFLFSSNLTDLVGAGFPFIGGAILMAGGLLALSNLSGPHKNPLVPLN